MQDVRSLDSYKANILGAREAIPRLLCLLEKHEIHATWATVGFIFAQDAEEALRYAPEPAQRPTYTNPARSCYRLFDDRELLAKEAEKRVDELLAKADAPPQPTLFDEEAFDAAVAKPNGWSNVADPVAEIRRMRGDEQPGNAAALRSVLMEACDIIRCYDMAEADGSFANQGEEVGDWFAKAEQALSAPARNVDLPECRTRDEAWKIFERESAGMWAADWDAAFLGWLFEPAKDEGVAK